MCFNSCPVDKKNLLPTCGAKTQDNPVAASCKKYTKVSSPGAPWRPASVATRTWMGLAKAAK
jgi:hypothetical protein